MNPSTVRAQHFPHYHKRWRHKRRQSIHAYIHDWYWLILIGGLAIVYYLVNYHWPRYPSTDSSIHLAQPLMWSSLGLMAYIGMRFGLRERQPFNKRLVTIAAITGVAQVALYALAGYLYGYGHSPHGHAPLVMLGNMLYAVSMLISVEMSRAYLVALFSRGSMTVALLVASYIFWFLSIPVSKYTSIIDLSSLLRVSGETFIPVGAENLLASFLALVGGPTASIAYRGVLQACIWLSPSLPNLHWTFTAFLGMVPIVSILIIRNQLLVGPVDMKASRLEVFRISTLWVLAGVALVTLFWFNTGVFGVQPTVVSGVSMEPTVMSGDVVITREVPAESVEVGDIIRFRRGDTFIIHRVVEVQMDGGEIQFITQGDANYSLDPPVRAYQLHGKVILTVPKIGWMTIAARQFIEWTP